MFEDLKKKLLDTNLFYDNEWLDKYINLIICNIGKDKIKFKTHRHHIIPKYYYNMNDIEIDNSKSNIVNLLFNDHALAHYYLAYASNTGRLRYKNYLAILHICNLDEKRFENITEDWLKTNLPLLSDLRTEAMIIQSKLSAERMTGENNPFYGKHHSEETNKKISIACLAAVTPEKRKILSDYGKARDNSAQVAAMAYYNSHFRDYSEQGKKISETKRRNNSGNNHANKIHIINKETNIQKYVKPEEFDLYCLQGWEKYKSAEEQAAEYKNDLRRVGWLGLRFVYLYNDKLYSYDELEMALHDEGFNIHWKSLRNIIENNRSRYFKELIGKIKKLKLTKDLFYSYFDAH